MPTTPLPQLPTRLRLREHARLTLVRPAAVPLLTVFCLLLCVLRVPLSVRLFRHVLALGALLTPPTIPVTLLARMRAVLPTHHACMRVVATSLALCHRRLCVLCVVLLLLCSAPLCSASGIHPPRTRLVYRLRSLTMRLLSLTLPLTRLARCLFRSHLQLALLCSRMHTLRRASPTPSLPT